MLRRVRGVAGARATELNRRRRRRRRPAAAVVIAPTAGGGRDGALSAGGARAVISRISARGSCLSPDSGNAVQHGR